MVLLVICLFRASRLTLSVQRRVRQCLKLIAVLNHVRSKGRTRELGSERDCRGERTRRHTVEEEERSKNQDTGLQGRQDTLQVKK